jgi:hypothetical protein
MMKRPVALVLSGLIGLVLGAGIGVAAAQAPTSADGASERAEMSLMHEEMRDQMPSWLADECDEMHAGMAGTMEQHSMMGEGPAAGRHGDGHHPHR